MTPRAIEATLILIFAMALRIGDVEALLPVITRFEGRS